MHLVSKTPTLVVSDGQVARGEFELRRVLQSVRSTLGGLVLGFEEERHHHVHQVQDPSMKKPQVVSKMVNEMKPSMELMQQTAPFTIRHSSSS